MKQQGWALAGVTMICAMMSAAICACWMSLADGQSALEQRKWLLQSRSAALSLIRDLHSGWEHAPVAPSHGCLQGRCAWLGDAALARSYWSTQLSNAANWGAYSGSTLGSEWPPLTGTRMMGWLETTASGQGTLVRITAWIQGTHASQSMVLQAVWLGGTSSASDGWVSWREVMP
jgi:hypothetical protein